MNGTAQLAPPTEMFSLWQEDPVGYVLNTGYYRFESPLGLDGLARIDGDHLELLAVVTRTRREGSFRAFIAMAKEHFPAVSVWNIWNDIVRDALVRYGFKPASYVEWDGEHVEGLQWKIVP